MLRIVLSALLAAMALPVACTSVPQKTSARARRALAPPLYTGAFAELHPDGGSHNHEAHERRGGGSREPEAREAEERGGHGGHDDGHEHLHEERPLSGHHHDHNEDSPTGHGARSVAVGLVFTVVLVPSVIALILEGGMWTLLTMKMIDTWTSIFLAVLWFNAFSQFLITFNFRKAFSYGPEVAAIIQCLVLYIIAMIVANLWRDKTVKLVTFCSCGAHYIAFAGIQAGGSTQRTFSDNVATSPEVEPVASFSFVIICLILLVLVKMITTVIFKRTRHGTVPEPVEELQLDIMGLVISFLITQAVRQTITGTLPAPHQHDGDKGHDEHAEHMTHKSWQRLVMLGWAIGLTILAMIAIPVLQRHQEVGDESYLAAVFHVTKVVLVMSVAWGYLLWGQWTFFETFFAGDQMFGQMLFAVSATLVCFLVLILIVKLAPASMSTVQLQSTSIIIMGVSLVTAWSWEHCFNVAFDVIGYEYQVGYGGLVPKLALAVLIPVCILPTYVRHVKPFVHELEEGHKEFGGGEAVGFQASTRTSAMATALRM